MVQTQLDEQPELLVIGLASNGVEAVEKAAQSQPDLILLDVCMPRLNGVQAAEQIGKLAPKAAILFLSQNTDPDVLTEALGTGGRGFVLKSQVGRDLLRAIEAVLRGGHFLSQELLDGDTWT
jgi:two-component system, NarL family, nitrate/nitrite response regulator NarL